MKIIDFKTISPLFEMERDGIKPFTERLIDYHDPRFRALAQWGPDKNWAIRITNPNTGEQFVRQIKDVDYIRYIDGRKQFPDWFTALWDWRIIIFGERLEVS